MHNVVILHSNWNALSVIHALIQKDKINIYLIDSNPGVASKSKYILKFFNVTDPMKDDVSTIKEINNIVYRFKGETLIIPTSDHWAMMLSKYKDSLPKTVKCLVSEFSIINILINKSLFYEWALDRGFSAPKSIDAAKPVFPLVAKFEYRRKSSSAAEKQIDRDIVNKLRIVLIHNQDELDNYIKSYKEHLEYIIFQEYIAGDSSNMHSIGVFSVDGEIKTLFSGRKVRGFPADVGDCIVGEVKKCPSYVLDEVKNLIYELNYTGIAEVEYKIDINTNIFRLIEINPRTWSWIGVTSYISRCNLINNAYEYYCLNKDVKYSDSLTVEDGTIRFIRVYEDIINNSYRYSDNVMFKVGLLKWLLEFKHKKNYIPELLESKILFYSTYYFIKFLIKSVLMKFKS